MAEGQCEMDDGKPMSGSAAAIIFGGGFIFWGSVLATAVLPVGLAMVGIGAIISGLAVKAEFFQKNETNSSPIQPAEQNSYSNMTQHMANTPVTQRQSRQPTTIENSASDHLSSSSLTVHRENKMDASNNFRPKMR